MLYCSVNGQISNQISITDRAFSYGDGVFTTAKIVEGEIEFLTHHLNRLVDSCSVLNIQFVEFDKLKSDIRFIAKNYSLAVLKVVITAGQGGRGYSRAGVKSANVIISVHEFPTLYKSWYQHGITLGVSNNQLGINPMLKGIKHLNRLEQVILRAELDRSVEDDLVAVNIKDQIVETCCANIFWVNQQRLVTPSIIDSGVKGIMRQNILSTLTNVEIVEESISTLSQATAIFICNCVMGIVPVREFQGRKLEIKPIQHIQQQFKNQVEAKIEN